MLAEAGDPADPSPFLLEAIAAEIVRCCGHNALKANRLAYGWTFERAVTALHTMCREQELGARGLTVRSWLEWEAGDHPSADYQDLLCRLFRTDPVSLGFRRTYRTCLAGTAPDPAGDEEPPPETGWVVNRVAQESVTHAAAAEISDVGATLLDSFGADVTRLARAYLHDAPGPLFTELVRVRRETCEILARRLRPAQQAELLPIAGQACGLLANACLDLGLAGSTYIRLGRPQQAITCAGTAIRLYEDGPLVERAYGNEAFARVDLVNGYLLGGELEAACQSAASIFELPSSQRIDGLSQRLHGVGGLLRSPRYQRAPRALEFIERIDEFQVTQGVLSGRTGSLVRGCW